MVSDSSPPTSASGTAAARTRSRLSPGRGRPRPPGVCAIRPPPLTGLHCKRRPYNVSLTHQEDTMTTLQLAPRTDVVPTRAEVVRLSTRTTSVLVAVLFLAATVTFA